MAKRPKRSRHRVDLDGAEDLEAAMKYMSEDLQGATLRDAVFGGAGIVADVASQLAPKSIDGSHGNEPGFLSRNIKAERQWTVRQDKAETHVGMNRDAWYGIFAERGTVYQAAEPFLRPAFDETKDDVVDEIEERLRRAIFRHTEG